MCPRGQTGTTTTLFPLYWAERCAYFQIFFFSDRTWERPRNDVISHRTVGGRWLRNRTIVESTLESCGSVGTRRVKESDKSSCLTSARKCRKQTSTAIPRTMRGNMVNWKITVDD